MAPTRYNVFISFSGETSLAAAKALREWLPSVVQSARPFMSESDVEKGSRGLQEITGVLEGIKVGIVCLAPDNLASPWIHYESGTLSKTVDEKTRLCTYLLCGLQPENVKSPLGLFQHTKAQKEDTRRLLTTINRAVGEEPIPESNLDEVFEAMWPKLEAKLRDLPPLGQDAAPKRSVEDMVAEILEVVRADSNRRKRLDWTDEYEPVVKNLFQLLAAEPSLTRNGVPLSTLAGKIRTEKDSGGT
jgi:hypothetical protein